MLKKKKKERKFEQGYKAINIHYRTKKKKICAGRDRIVQWFQMEL